MKVRFFTLVTILVILTAGFLAYLNVNKKNTPSNQDADSENITIQPTQVSLPSATPTPEPAKEAVTELYPAYQIKDNLREFGYINSTGKFVIKPSFDTANDFHEGYAIVSMGKEYMAIDSIGSILYINENPIRDFQNGAAVISRYSDKDTLYGYINTEGEEIIKPLYKMVSDFESDGTAYVYQGNKIDLINKAGKTIKSYEINKNYHPVSLQDGYVIYYTGKSGNYGVISVDGKDIIKPHYHEILYLGDHLFAVKRNNNVSYDVDLPVALFNSQGEQLTGFTLYDISSFHDGYASVTDSTSTYFIGPDGKKAVDLPQWKGRGTVTLFGEVIKAEIDNDLLYAKKDNTVFWQNDTTQTLTDGIIAKSNKYKPNKYAVVYYPQLDGLTDTAVQTKINAKLKSLFTGSRADLNEDDMISVNDTFKASMMNRLIIIERDGYDFPFGAAHGIPIMDFFFIDSSTGTFYQLKDLFIKDIDYKSKLNQLITDQMTAQSQDENSMYFAGSFTGITDNQYFKISEDALTIYFYPYDIAAYAAGFPEFEIPYEDIYDYIDFQGAFWRAFK